ncbi:MAG: DUF3822 family protein [Rikenellaceae bacterium]|nr:DUF3822 family protein [Rikenellaceae bacterium]MBQ5719598.1 DUF3822 family protein [Alistipes sp.]
MSIQLTLSGHSFSRSDLPKLSTDKQFVEIEVLSSRVVLIPFELFEEVNPVEILAINGITLNENESVVTVPDEQQQIVAALALPNNLIAAAQERYGDNHLFSTPLLRSRICTEPTAWLYLAERIIYIKVWSDGKLRMAEVLPRKKETDTLYYTAAIDKQFDLKHFKIVIEGANGFADEARETAKTLSKYYKKVVCE